MLNKYVTEFSLINILINSIKKLPALNAADRQKVKKK
jgi:hypothetical protein